MQQCSRELNNAMGSTAEFRCKTTAALLALCVSACGSATQGGPSEPTTGSEASASPIAGKQLLGQFVATATPGVPGWTFEPVLLGADQDVDGITRRTAALVGVDGDETEPVAIGTQVSLANCSEGSCGGKCSGSVEIPTWYSGYCLGGEFVAQGKVSITNLTSDKYLIEPVAVFSNLQPASLEFFSTFPFPPSGTCASYGQTRTVDPLAGAYYARYGNIAPGECEDGQDLWITAPTEADDANAAQGFTISIYAESLEVTQVLNGGFESGLDNWSVSSDTGVGVISEHCSHENDFTCGAGDSGIVAPAGGAMARLTTIDGGTAYSAYLQSDPVVLGAASSLTFRSKLGTREPANFCGATQRDDTWYVEARKNGGSWIQLDLPNPPDDDGDGVVEAIDDCRNFDDLGLAAVYEQAWNPGSTLPEHQQDFETVTTDLSAAPLSAVAGDEVEFRFWVVGGGDPAGLGASVFLLDDVQIVAN